MSDLDKNNPKVLVSVTVRSGRKREAGQWQWCSKSSCQHRVGVQSQGAALSTRRFQLSEVMASKGKTKSK